MPKPRHARYWDVQAEGTAVQRIGVRGRDGEMPEPRPAPVKADVQQAVHVPRRRDTHGVATERGGGAPFLSSRREE